MKASFFIHAIMGVALGGICHAQMSTFPKPPPLSPPSDQDAATSAPTPGSLAPAMTDPTTAPAKGSDAKPDATGTTPAPALTAAKLSSISALDDKVALEAGDTVSFRVIEDRDDPVSRPVTDTGEVDFPYIGRVKVLGKTCHQVALEVKKLLEVDYYKHATVIVGLDVIVGQDNKTKPRDLVWVVGQVKDVGPQELQKAQPMTVSQIILRAGGFGDFADQRKVKVIHRGADGATSDKPLDITDLKDAQVIDVKSVFDGKSTLDPSVKAGDYIIVPKKWVNL